MMPPRMPILVAAPSQPIAFMPLVSTFLLLKYAINSAAITLLDPAVGVIRPKNVDPDSAIIDICFSVIIFP